MFPDSDIAKKFACDRTEATSIIKEAISPYTVKNEVFQ